MDLSNRTTAPILGLWFQSNNQDKENGLAWYSNAYTFCLRIAAELGFSVDQIAGAIAALSPNNKWERNCQDAENLARAIKAGIDIDSVKVCTFGNNKAKAVKILSSDVDSAEIVSILRGQKIVAFYLNIARNGDTDCPVIDGHAYNIAMGTVGSLRDVPSITPKGFETIQNLYRDAAATVSQITGETVSAGQVQAVTWVCYRRIHKGLQ
tara:strand:- start:605 stop:1231 length:627 start_codon:yes stop_codon:yes gene_type:complete